MAAGFGVTGYLVNNFPKLTHAQRLAALDCIAAMCAGQSIDVEKRNEVDVAILNVLNLLDNYNVDSQCGIVSIARTWSGFLTAFGEVKITKSW
jgi:hypothetical protein